ncbi:hypothetical protein CRV02_13560 [Arcobacter sp. CECT 8989]|uniref:hypothetical protein n=1 Tax=Arcobacter sp. CECT 8989 TaxID=2044509 RepID=UPI00100A8C2C|nr:hypothetical protein [Arcobacter sp. CECT 8989]RXJ98271.1 hypothetical protein CRV02_13560 [Arcobacter sp. CECT 8989]
MIYKLKDYKALLYRYGFACMFIILGLYVNFKNTRTGIPRLESLMENITLVWYVLMLLSFLYIVLTIRNTIKGIVINAEQKTIEFPTLFTRKNANYSEVTHVRYEPGKNEIILTGKSSPIVFKVYSDIVAQNILSKITEAKAS